MAIKKSRAEFNVSYALQSDWSIKVYEESEEEANDINLLVIYKDNECVVRFEQSHHGAYHVHIGEPIYRNFPDVKTREEKIKKAFSVLEELIANRQIKSHESLLEIPNNWKYLESQVLSKAVAFGNGMAIRNITGVSRILPYRPRKLTSSERVKHAKQEKILNELLGKLSK
jgi:hypothetical protein